MNSNGSKLYNTTLGDRILLEEKSKHCFDESNWVYQNWLNDKEVLFTPYSSGFALIEDIEVLIQGEIETSSEASEFVSQYFDFINIVGYDQSALFYNHDSIRELKTFMMKGIDEDDALIQHIKNISFSALTTREDLMVMTDIDFMNKFLKVMKILTGSNTINLGSLKIINEFNLGDKKYVVVEKKEIFMGQESLSNEVLILKNDNEQWKLDLTGWGAKKIDEVNKLYGSQR